MGQCPICGSELVDDAAFCPRCGAAQPDSPACDDFRYAAFVSYRHLPYDSQVAFRVQRGIESYRLPRGVTFASPVSVLVDARPRRLGPVFRDVDELPASDSLPDSICEALKASSALVVVCSRTTAQSAWVAREVELFASYHGRSRIFIALAEGEVKDVAPELLLTRVEMADTASCEVPVEPMAADFRPEARSRFRSELLRLVAGIVGCGYDDLRRRERVRHRRRMAGAVTAATALAVAIGGFGWHSARRVAMSDAGALANESRALVAQSRQQLAEGDRYGAIRTALLALPDDKDPERPVTDEAKDALADALEVYPAADTIWRSSYCIDMPAYVAKQAVSPGGEWFALLDTDFGLRTYDTVTGRQLASCQLPEATTSEEGADALYWNLIATDDRLLAAPRWGDESCLVCFDAKTGEELWQVDDFYCYSLCTSLDGQIVVASVFDDNGLYVSAIDAGNGETKAFWGLDDAALPFADIPAMSVMGDTTADIYIASGDQVRYLNLATGETWAAALSQHAATSIAWVDDTLVVTSSDAYATVDNLSDVDSETGDADIGNDAARTHVYAIDAFDGGLVRRWSDSGAYDVGFVNTKSGAVRADLAPESHGTTLLDDGTKAVICSMGQDVRGYALDDGRVEFEFEETGPVVGAGPTSLNVAMPYIDVVAADGSLTQENMTGDMQWESGSTSNVMLPDSLSEASMTLPAVAYAVVLAQSASDPARIYAYHTDYSQTIPDYANRVGDPNTHLPDPDKADWTVDELVDLAHEVLPDDEDGGE